MKIHEGPAYKSGICEPSISVDPTNPMNIYAASILDNFYQSTDGGRSWTLEKISSSFGVWGDPCHYRPKWSGVLLPLKRPRRHQLAQRLHIRPHGPVKP